MDNRDQLRTALAPGTPAFIILILVLCTAAVLVFTAIIRRRRRSSFEPMDDLEGHDFEFYCADLLRRNGFRNVTVTRGSGDYGADILAERDEVTYAVQCKTYGGPVGVAAVEEAVAGREFYDRMVGVVMANQYFTKNAVTAAGKLNILLWDRDRLRRMEQE